MLSELKDALGFSGLCTAVTFCSALLIQRWLSFMFGVVSFSSFHGWRIIVFVSNTVMACRGLPVVILFQSGCSISYRESICEDKNTT